MGVIGASAGWAALVLCSVTLAVRGRRSPVDHPLPTSVAVGTTFGLVAAVVGLAPVTQAMTATGVAMVMVVLFWRWRALAEENHLPPGVGGRRLIGQDGLVVEPLRDSGGAARVGSVRVGSELWKATTTADHDLAVGGTVRVTAVTGTRVVVVPVLQSVEDHDRGT